MEEEDTKRATESLAALALTDQRSDVLKFCLDRGFVYNGYFIDAANNFEKAYADSDISKILQASRFRQMWPWPKPKKDLKENSNSSEETDPAEVFDYGGEYEVDW